MSKPTLEQLEEELKLHSKGYLGRKYGVSHTTINRWLGLYKSSHKKVQGSVAQGRLERSPYKREVTGSTPVATTKNKHNGETGSRENSNSKGCIGEAYIVALLLDLGFNVLKPVIPTLKYDLLVEKSQKYVRVQCKYKTLRKGKLIVPRNTSNNKGKLCTTYSQANIDIIAVYCPNNGKVYFMSIQELSKCKSSISLRVVPPKNQFKNMVDASSYEDFFKAWDEV